MRTTKPLRVDVQWQLGKLGEICPRTFLIGNTKVEITEVVDRWIGRDQRYYKVRSPEGFYILRHDSLTCEWELHLFSREDYLAGKNTAPESTANWRPL